MSKLAVIPIDRPPDKITFTGGYVKNENGIFVGINCLVAVWDEPASTLELLLVTDGPDSRSENKFTKQLMSATQGSRIETPQAALCKRLKP